MNNIDHSCPLKTMVRVGRCPVARKVSRDNHGKVSPCMPVRAEGHRDMFAWPKGGGVLLLTQPCIVPPIDMSVGTFHHLTITSNILQFPLLMKFNNALCHRSRHLIKSLSFFCLPAPLCLPLG